MTNSVLYIVCFTALGAFIGGLVHSVWMDYKPRDIKANFYLTKQKDSNNEDILVPYMELLEPTAKFIKDVKDKPTTIEVRVFYDEQ